MRTLEALALTFFLNALWQVPAVILAASLGERLLRRGPDRLRHALWVFALAACVLLPAASLVPDAPEAAPVPNVPVEILAAPPAAGTVPQPAPGRGPILPPFALGAAAILYGISVLGYGIRLGLSWRRARALAREAWPPTLSEEAAAIAGRCWEAFGLGEVDILCSDQVPGPVTLGTVRPVILLPPALLEGSTPDELTSALGHEMAHVRRRDYALHLAGELLLVPVSFHPAVRRLRQRLAESREMACDEATVERVIGARAYARSLLSLAASISGLPRPALTLGVHLPTGADTLEERMKRLTDPRSRLGARLALAPLSLALLLLAGTGLAASSLALDAPSGPGNSAWSPFLGVWHTEFPDKDGNKLPGSDLEIRLTNGQPEAILTMHRHRKNPDGSVRTDSQVIPAYDLRVEGQSLIYRFRTALQYREGGRRVVLEHTNRLELTGEGEGVIHSLGGKTADDRSQLPPPPPPQTARRAR